jgi:hypothetical protein
VSELERVVAESISTGRCSRAWISVSDVLVTLCPPYLISRASEPGRETCLWISRYGNNAQICIPLAARSCKTLSSRATYPLYVVTGKDIAPGLR